MDFIKNLKIIEHEFVYSGHLIAFASVCIVFSSALLLNIKIGIDFLMIIYLLTFSALLFNRYKEQRIDILNNSIRTGYLTKYFNYTILILFISIFISAGIMIYYTKLISLFFYFVLVFLSLLYTKYFKNLTRFIFLFKNISFSLLTISLLVLMTTYYDYLFDFAFLMICVFVFLRMFINTVFLDIKDVEGDTKMKLKTIPVLFGEMKTLKILQLLSIISILPILLGIYLKILPLFSLILILIVPYSFYYFSKSKKRKNFYLVNYFLADSEFILWLILTSLAKTLIIH